MTATLGSYDPLPSGPYRVALTYDFTGKRHTPPYTIVASNGQTIAGHIESLAAAELIRDRLNGVSA